MTLTEEQKAEVAALKHSIGGFKGTLTKKLESLRKILKHSRDFPTIDCIETITGFFSRR